MIENYSCNLLPQITWIDRIFSNNGLKRITQIATTITDYKDYKDISMKEIMINYDNSFQENSIIRVIRVICVQKNSIIRFKKTV